MEVPVLRLGADDLWCALEEVDPVEFRMAQVVDDVPGHDDGRLMRFRPGNRVTAAGGRPADDEPVLLEEPTTAARCVLPSSTLCLCRATMMVALAAGELQAAGEMTVALLASGDAAHFHLAALAWHVAGVGDVCLTSAHAPAPLDTRVLALLDRAGIELSVVTTVDEAVLGANLLIATGWGHDDLTKKHLPRGALLVNVAGRDLPNDIVDRIDQIYVDDLGLLEHNRHRRFAAMHLRQSAHGGPASFRPTEDRRHQRAGRRHLRRVEADIRQVISGHHVGRTHPDDVLLFELLGVREPDVALASRIYQTARARGLGVWSRENLRLENWS